MKDLIKTYMKITNTEEMRTLHQKVIKTELKWNKKIDSSDLLKQHSISVRFN